MSRSFRSLVLCYHAVSDGWPDALAVPPGALERQLASLLRRGYRPVGAADVLAGKARLLHVTFDDAYRSVANALPALGRLGVPATVFACPAYADTGRALDVPELAEEARTHPEELATMRWDDLRALRDHDVEVGSHTLTHPHLKRLSDAELERELGESRKRIEEELGRPCRFLAYPYGEHDERVQSAARAAGYDAAFALAGRDETVTRHAGPRVGIWRRDGRLRVAAKTSPTVRRAAPWALSVAPPKLLQLTRIRDRSRRPTRP